MDQKVYRSAGLIAQTFGNRFTFQQLDWEAADLAERACARVRVRVCVFAN